MPTATQLPIDTTATATEMADEIFGSGMTVNSATYSGDAASSGIYTNGDTVSPGATPGDTGVILSTGNATDYTNNTGTLNTNENANTGTNTAGIDGDTQFNNLAGANTFDASILDINFTPVGDTLTIDFIIASEEYPEYISSNFLDVVGVWVNGVEAQVTIGDGSASVGNINGAETPNIYNDNTADQFNTEMDGLTVTLSFTAPVNPGVPNTLRIGVADVSDSGYDTNLLVAGGSIQSSIVAQDDQITLGNDDTQIVDVLANDSSTGGAMTVTKINGTDVVAGDSVTLVTGQIVTLNPDGTLSVDGDSDPETVYFTYTAEDASGNEDTGMVEVEQVPCFARGTMIETPDGPRLIETLIPGDLVMTNEAGPMPLLWVATRNVAATGINRPVRIHSGHFGAERDVIVSPNHRIAIQHPSLEILFGEPTVFVCAKSLINGVGADWATEFETITYVHVLLDQHYTLKTSGLNSESYHPGPLTLQTADRFTKAQIHRLFPSLQRDPMAFGPSVYLTVKPVEVPPLLQAIAHSSPILELTA